MIRERIVDILKPGDIFRDWLFYIAPHPADDNCDIIVSIFTPASHTVCKYEFHNQGYAVVVKFFGEPTGALKTYNAESAMETEYRRLMQVSQIIPAPRVLARHRDFSCCLATEFVEGVPLLDPAEDSELFDRAARVALLHRRLHDFTREDYERERAFIAYQNVLNGVDLGDRVRREFENQLVRWRRSGAIDSHSGCMIHRDATISNYIFNNGGVTALDFESSWENAHPVYDCGIFCAELKRSFADERGDGRRAERFIEHYLARYCRNDEDFQYVTGILPFFMSLGHLRMARLDLPPDYRDYLVYEALMCLYPK